MPRLISPDTGRRGLGKRKTLDKYVEVGALIGAKWQISMQVFGPKCGIRFA